MTSEVQVCGRRSPESPSTPTTLTKAWATLLDEGAYLGSISRFYRLPRRAGEIRERRRQATHPDDAE